mmetsp:Transcript_15160/g.21077  ORF Transcript_15160/g.21077 Transcript_15160/m.21077 type:complete len:245 (+) Transcript_15160:46-780(+)
MYVRLENTLNNRTQKHDSFADREIKHVLQALTEIGKNIERIPGSQSEANKGRMEKLERIFGEICDKDKIIRARSIALRETRMWMRSEDYNNENMDWEGKINEFHEEAKAKHADNLNHQREQNIKKFKRELWDVNHHGESMPGDDEEDLVAVDMKRNFKCPITGDLLENPVKNQSCGHIYSKEAIYALLKGKQKVKCPCAGCSQYVTKAGLVKDKKIEKDLRAFIEEEERKKLNNSADIDFTQTG